MSKLCNILDGKYTGKQLKQGAGEEKISLFPSGFLGWSNNKIDLRHFDKRKTNLISYIQEPH